MATLNDMLLAELIKIGDTIEFTFKGNTFRAKILRGGLIGKCQQQSIHDKEPVSVLETTVGFSSLTAWTESCLQDLLEEYYTRYSSWKRVYHRESKRSMSDLRDQCKLKERKSDDVMELYKEIRDIIKKFHTYHNSLPKAKLLILVLVFRGLLFLLLLLFVFFYWPVVDLLQVTDIRVHQS